MILDKKNTLILEKVLNIVFPKMEFLLNISNNEIDILISNYRGIEVLGNEGYIILDDGMYPILRIYDYFDGFLPQFTEKINFIYHNGDSLIKIYSPFKKITDIKGYL